MNQGRSNSGKMASPSSGSPKKLGAKVGHGLARVLGIDLEHATSYEQQITRGESVYSLSGSSDAYIDTEPTVLEYFSQFKPTGRGLSQYLLSFFPFVTWIGR